MAQTRHADLFAGCERAWEALPRLAEFVAAQLQPGIQGEISPQATVGDKVQIGTGTVGEAGAMITGPAIVAPLASSNTSLATSASAGTSTSIMTDCSTPL